MTPQQFQDWIRGYLDGAGDGPLDESQVKRIRDELAKVKAAPVAQPFVDWAKLIPAAPLPAVPLWPSAGQTWIGTPDHTWSPKITCGGIGGGK